MGMSNNEGWVNTPADGAFRGPEADGAHRLVLVVGSCLRSGIEMKEYEEVVMNNGNGMLRELMDLGAHTHSENTRRAYDTQYRLFVEWTEKQGRWVDLAPAYPPEAVCEYLDARAERGNTSSTLQLIVCAIRARSKNAGLPDPTRNETVRRMLRGARIRGHGLCQATGLTHRDMLKIRPLATPKQWALLRLMRDCLLRRSEASTVRWRDLSPEPDGTGRLTVPHSKTDQEGKGAVLFVSKRTMAALKAIRPWPTPAVGEKIFRWCPYSISCNIARLAEQAGLKGDYSGHSPRIGMVQDLARLGALLTEIQDAGRWKDPSMPARYIRGIDTRYIRWGIDAGHSAVARYSEFL